MPSPFKKKKGGRVLTPTPLVAALGREPVKADTTWKVRDSGAGAASTDLHNGMLSVPLIDAEGPCKICDTPNGHNDAIRTHEMIHVRISPSKLPLIMIPKTYVEAIEVLLGATGLSNAVFNSIYTRVWETHDEIELIPVSEEAGIVAEEYIVENLRMDLIRNSRIAFGQSTYFCLPNFKKSFLNLLAEKKYKDAVYLAISVGNNHTAHNYMYKLSRGIYLGKYRKSGEKARIMEIAEQIYGFVNHLNRNIQILEYRLPANVTMQQRLNARRTLIRVVTWFFVRKLEKKRSAPSTITVKQLIEDGEIPEDMEALLTFAQRRVGGGNTEEQAIQTMKSVMDAPEKSMSLGVRWGEMTIVRPPLPKKLPLWKIQRKNTPADEGTIPSYMHRYAVDQRVFRKTKREYGASVLIDDSGSMSLSVKDLDEIIQNVPGVVIGAYAGQNGHGNLKILAENGKRVAHGDEKVGMGGNEIDRPALEWLAQQVEPRIWVSDGYVVPSDGGYGDSAIKECMAICIRHNITRANNVGEAKEMLTGKRALQR